MNLENTDRWQTLGRRLWPILAMLAIAILLASLPIYISNLDSGIIEGRIQAPDWLIRAVSYPSAFFSFVTAAVSLGLAALLYWRRRTDRMALFLAYMFLFYGIIMGGPLERVAATFDLQFLSDTLQPLLVVFFTALIFTFPDGRFFPRESRWLVLASVFLIPVLIFLSIELKNRPFGRWQDYAMVVGILGLIGYGFYSQYIRYRRISSHQQRLQAKWVMYGLALWFFLILISSFQYYAVLSLPDDAPLSIWFLFSNFMWWSGLSILPIVFTVAVLRYRLYDINLIIRRTLIYGLLTATLAGVYFLGILSLQAIFRAITGQESPLAIIISTLIIAALFNPLRGRLQDLIDRRFFRSKFDASRTLAEFTRTARDEVDVEVLTGELLRVVQETMQPSSIGIWLLPKHEQEAE